MVKPVLAILEPVDFSESAKSLLESVFKIEYKITSCTKVIYVRVANYIDGGFLATADN